RTRQDQRADNHYERLKGQTQRFRSHQMHGESGEQVRDVVGTNRVRNDHAREKRDDTGTDNRKHANDGGRDLQVLEFGIRDLAVDLRQRLEATHRQQRVTKGNDDRYKRNGRPDGSVEPPETVLSKVQVLRNRSGRDLRRTLNEQSQASPDE